MSIKAGQLLHSSGSVVIDRLQTAGPGLNIPTEKVYELGNYESVATIRDVPDLTFNMESFDVSTEMEQLLVGGSAPFNMAAMKTIDVASHFKAGQTAAAPYQVVNSVAVPQLAPESVSYRFGLRDNARQTVALRGDSIYYSPGSTFIETFTASGSAGQTLTLANTALAYNGDSTTRYALNVSVGGVQLTHGAEYSDTATTVTITNAQTASASIRITYASAATATYNQAVHQGASVKPAAIRGRDIDIYVGGTAASARWTSVQAVNVDYRLTLEADEEFGNYHAVSRDYDVPAVTGSVDLKPRDPAELLNRIRQVAGVSATNEAVGPFTSQPLGLWITLKRPVADAGGAAGSAIKTLYIDDARFTVPGYTGNVQQKITVTFSFESDTGHLVVQSGGPTP